VCIVSVIMATYKEEEKYLREAIESILNQTYSRFEYIIILDNPDNKQHINIIKEYAAADSRIKFIINEENKGLTTSLNRGLTLAKGKYICRMDADDIAINDRIEKQLEYLISNNYDLIGGLTDVICESGEQMYSIKKLPINSTQIQKALKYNNCIPHPTWFAKRDIFDKLNGYRDICACEDYDLLIRASLAGYRLCNINYTVLKYRMTSNSISRSNLYEQYLYMKYITAEYSKGNVANVDEAITFVNKNNTERKSNNYSIANQYFNEMLINLNNKKICPFITNGLKLLFCSKSYVNKIYRLFRVSSL